MIQLFKNAFIFDLCTMVDFLNNFREMPRYQQILSYSFVLISIIFISISQNPNKGTHSSYESVHPNKQIKQIWS